MSTADELAGLLETVHLLRSPRNAEHLLTALVRAREKILQPQSLDELRQEVGLNDIDVRFLSHDNCDDPM